MSEVNPQNHLSITGDHNFEGNISLDDFKNSMPQHLQILKQSKKKLMKQMLTYAAFQRVSEVSTFKTRIANALKKFGTNITPYLIQFWEPEPQSVDGKRYLISSELPFSISNIDRGSSSYRKRCTSYRYSVDSGRSIGPPARVFLRETAEYNEITDFSLNEYPLRDYALTCRAQDILFMPIYEPQGTQCIGVVEYISFGEIGIFIEDDLHDMSRIFKSEDLMLKDLPCSLMDFVEYIELDIALKHSCDSLYIPFAQVWRPCTDWETGTLGYSVIKQKWHKGKSRSYKPFYTKCISVPLKDHEGAVGKAFSSHTSFFCKLSTDVHPLADDASKLGFIYNFAVCLRHITTGYKTYILEFFVSNSATTSIDPLDLVRSVLDTIKRKCPSLRQASGQELGVNIQILLPSPETEVPQNTGEMLHSSLEAVAGVVAPNDHIEADIMLLDEPSETNSHTISSSQKDIVPTEVDPSETNAHTISSSQEDIVPTEAEPSETNAHTISGSQEDIVPTEAETMRLDQPSVANAQHINTKDIAPLKKAKVVKKLKSLLTFEIIQQHAVGQIELVARHLTGESDTSYKASMSSIRRIIKKNKFKDWHELKKKMCSRLDPKYVTAATKHIREVGCKTEVPGFSPHVTVNALYLEKTKPFEFSIVKDMKDLVEKLAKVFKLQPNNLKMEYENEDGEWTSLANDEDLSTCFSNLKKFRDAMVHVHVVDIS